MRISRIILGTVVGLGAVSVSQCGVEATRRSAWQLRRSIDQTIGAKDQ